MPENTCRTFIFGDKVVRLSLSNVLIRVTFLTGMVVPHSAVPDLDQSDLKVGAMWTILQVEAKWML